MCTLALWRVLQSCDTKQLSFMQLEGFIIGNNADIAMRSFSKLWTHREESIALRKALQHVTYKILGTYFRAFRHASILLTMHLGSSAFMSQWKFENVLKVWHKEPCVQAPSTHWASPTEACLWTGWLHQRIAPRWRWITLWHWESRGVHLLHGALQKRSKYMEHWCSSRLSASESTPACHLSLQRGLNWPKCRYTEGNSYWELQGTISISMPSALLKQDSSINA